MMFVKAVSKLHATPAEHTRAPSAESSKEKKEKGEKGWRRPQIHPK
jgi:hypothetical protein